MKFLKVAILMILYTYVQAQYDHTDLFPRFEDEELRQKLIGDYKPLNIKSYTEARHFMFRNVYNTSDSVETIYSGLMRYLDPAIEDPIQYLLQGDNNLQVDTEHSYPRSKGATTNTDAGSDLHHLFPCRKQVNGSRANLPFGEVVDETTVNWYYKGGAQQSIPSDDIDNYSELGSERFEPREGKKGNIARAIFYFYTMYREAADQADPQFFDVQKEDLCDWHFEDPVDSLEWIRSKMIGEFQGHEANPFVLDCSLAARLYCDEISDACAFLTSIESVDDSDITLYPNPTGNFVKLHLDNHSFDKESELILYDHMGRKITSLRSLSEEVIFDLGNISPGVYFLLIVEGGKITGRSKVVKF